MKVLAVHLAKVSVYVTSGRDECELWLLSEVQSRYQASQLSST